MLSLPKYHNKEYKFKPLENCGKINDQSDQKNLDKYKKKSKVIRVLYFRERKVRFFSSIIV